MIHEERFVLSHRQYAVDMVSLSVGDTQQGARGPYWWCSAQAVWFRRRRGVTVACYGRLRDLQHARPQTARQFLEQHDDGRYGGDCLARWDGESYWGAEGQTTLAAMEKNLGVLRPMLENYPQIPDGYEGWWRF